MKKLSLFLAIILCMSIILSSVATAVKYTTDAVNPFTGREYAKEDFYGNGMILVVLEHEYSIVWREYTFDDFPELDLELVDTHPDFCDRIEYKLENPYYRNMVFLTLNDKSEDAMVEAIEILYEYHDAEISFAQPVQSSYTVGGLEEEDMPIGGVSDETEETGVKTVFAADSEFENIYNSVDEIPAGSTVYYRLVCEDGYFVHEITVNSDTVDENSFVMPDEELEFDVDKYLRGDGDKNGVVSISDVSFVLKYLSGYGEICYKVNGTNCGNAYIDFNMDGDINIEDCIEMLKYIAHWEGFGPVAPEYEEDFNIINIDSNIDIASYFVESAFLDDSRDVHDIINRYNKIVIKGPYTFAHFLGETMGVNDVFYDVTSDGTLTQSDINTIELKNVYDEEFFETYDLLPIIVESNHHTYIGDVYRDGTKLYVDVVIGDEVDSSMDDYLYEEYSFFFVAVPKGSTEDRRYIPINEGAQSPDEFFIVYEYVYSI